MNATVISIIAIICLTILGIFIMNYIPGETKLLYGIVTIIAGLAGYYIPKAVQHIKKLWKK